MTPNWLDSYYEALEFFYWEPHHIRPKTKAAAEFEKLTKLAKRSSKVAWVKKHLRDMEVTLNHNLSQFFRLAPNSLPNDLFADVFKHKFDQTLALEDRDVDAKYELRNSTQPDLLFISESSVVSIEMKIKSKSSLEQILKYALLGLAIENQDRKSKERYLKKHYLLLLGPGTFSAQFRARFETIDKLRDATIREDLASFLENKPSSLRDQQRLEGIRSEMRIQFLGYAGLISFLRSKLPDVTDESPAAEVYRKLIQGLCDEIEIRRHLL